MKRITLLSILCMFLTIPIVTGQSTFSTSGQSGITVQNPPPGTASREYQNNDSFNNLAPMVITHSLSQDIVSPNSVACGSDGIPAESDYYRDFDLPGDFGITTGFTVSNVEFGVELADGPVQVTLNIYSTTSTFPTGYPGSLTFQGTADYTVNAADSGAVISVPLSAIIPAGSIMVYEYHINPGATNRFYPGSNDLGQTGVSWIQAEECDITTPTNAGDIGAADMHLVMNVVGEEGITSCNGMPDAGIAMVNPASGGPGSTYNVTAQGTTAATGMSFQWQSSTNGIDWQNEGDATDVHTPYSATAPTQVGDQVLWRLASTCTVSGDTAFSDVATFTTAITYCPGSGNNATYENITNVTYAGINNTTTTHSGYNDFTDQVATVNPEATEQISVTIDSDGSDYLYVFIDWNQNGTLDDAGEVYTLATSTSTNGPHIMDITVPEGASLGNTRMRVKLGWNEDTPNPCGTFSYGEVEDYTVNVAPAVPVPTVNLNSAANFGILAATAITSAGPSIITNGDVGISPGVRADIEGFPPATVVNGEIYASDDPGDVPAMLAQAKLDLQNAYLFAEGASAPAPATIAGDQGGKTLAPGIYKSNSSLLIQTGDLTLDAQGDPDASWIFQIESALTTIGGPGGNVILAGGAQAKNITWQVGSSATIGDNTSFSGNILAYTSITMNSGSTIDGRLLAMNGAVVLTGAIMVNLPDGDCEAPEMSAYASDDVGEPIQGCIEAGGTYYVYATLSGGSGNDTYSVTANDEDPVVVDADSSVVLGPFTVGTDVNVIAVGVQDDGCSVSASVDSPAICDSECDAPTDLSVNVTGPTTAQVTWLGDADDYEIAWGVSPYSPGDPGGTQIDTGNTNTYAIATVASTEYDVYVRAICDDINSGWTSTSFTSGEADECHMPTDASIDNITDNSADITWTPADAADDHWGVSITTIGQSPEDGMMDEVNDDPSYTATGLDPDTNYNFYVRTICETGLTSEWFGGIPFTTEDQQEPCEDPYNEDAATSDVYISNMEFAGIGIDVGNTDYDFTYTSNTMSTNGYEVITNPTLTVYPGLEGEYTVSSGPNGNSNQYYYSVWVDFNQDGCFDADEQVIWSNDVIWGGGIPNGETGVTNVPMTWESMAPGTYQARIRNSMIAHPMAEGNGDGEALDFTVEVITEEDARRLLGIEGQVFNNFTYYPNPVEGQLYLSASTSIEQVEVYSLLGQKVIQMQPNALEVNLATDQLQAGVYLMSVTIDGSQKTFRVVKK